MFVILHKNLVTEGSLEDLHFELASEDLAGLVLGQGLDEHDAAAELLVRGDSLGDVVYDLLLLNTAVAAHDVGAGELAGALIGDADDGDVINAVEATDQVFQLGGSNLSIGKC